MCCVHIDCGEKKCRFLILIFVVEEIKPGTANVSRESLLKLFNIFCFLEVDDKGCLSLNQFLLLCKYYILILRN